MGLAYRREIDGLRAIAVGAVVLYHAGVGPSAGFVGVDVFFVISGYLITALLLREQDASGRISLAGFYARRVRRIFPVAAVLILAVLGAASLLPATITRGIAESATASALFVANIYFQSAAESYFHANSAQAPLLHLWSLAVEEQFYFVWPLLLIFVPRRWLVPALLGVTAASLACAEWLIVAQPSAAFYQAPARAWELAVGGLVACAPLRLAPRAMLPAGLLVTLAAIVIPTAHFPGLGAVPAVVGAALILAAVHWGATSSFLSSRPMVGLGLISYSLYLWHWPLLAFDRLVRIEPAPLQTRLCLVAIAVVLAVLSYRYIEGPARRIRWRSSRTVALGFATMAVLSCAAWTWRTPAPAAKVEVASNFERLCYPYGPGVPVVVQRPECVGHVPKVVIWGDSYANAWAPFAAQLAERQGMPAVSLARNGCPALPGAKVSFLGGQTEARTCEAWNRRALAYISSSGADTVVIVSRWRNFMLEGTGGGEALRDAVAAISPRVRQVLIIGPTPEMPEAPERCAALGVECGTPRATFEADASASRLALASVAGPKVRLLDAGSWLCGPDFCPARRGNLDLYTDAAHVNGAAAAEFAAVVASQVTVPAVSLRPTADAVGEYALLKKCVSLLSTTYTTDICPAGTKVIGAIAVPVDRGVDPAIFTSQDALTRAQRDFDQAVARGNASHFGAPQSAGQ